MDTRSFRILSLFSGGGGGDLAMRIAVPHARTVCFVENNYWAQQVLLARIKDGSLEDAPLWDDVVTFDGKPWRRAVDCIIGGFPCVAISAAGKREGIDGEGSNLWREYARLIREIRPRLVFIENVAALLVRGIDRVLGNLADLGYDAEWLVLSAQEVGAPQLRRRIFILAWDREQLANANDRRRRKDGQRGVHAEVFGGGPDQRRSSTESDPQLANPSRQRRQQESRSAPRDEGANGRQPHGDHFAEREGEGLADATGEQRAWPFAEGDRRGQSEVSPGDRSVSLADADGLAERESHDQASAVDTGGARQAPIGRGDREDVPVHSLSGVAQCDAYGSGQLQSEGGLADERGRTVDASDLPLFPPGPDDADGWRDILARYPDLAPAIKPKIRGLADGVAAGVGLPEIPRVEQLRILGNGIVAACGAAAFIILARRAGIEL